MGLTIIASSTTSAKFLDPKACRKGVVIENTDANRLHILLGSGTASTTNYSVSLAQNANITLYGFRGEINGIWATDGTGSAFITEF